MVIVLQIPLDTFLPVAKGDSAGALILQSPLVSDARLKEISSPVAGQQLFLTTALANLGETDTQYVLFTEVRNETGVTIKLDSRWGMFNSGENVEVHHAWRAENAGTFELRSFVISAECFPEVLTEVDIVRFEVKPPDGSEQLPPKLEDLSQEQIRQLTREEIEAIELEENRKADIDSEISDAEDLRLEAKERRIRDVIWSDDRIREYQMTMAVFGYDSDFAMDERSLCDNAEMTILLSRERLVEGDWQTSYTSTLSGRLELNVSVVNGAISSILENPLNDTTTEHFFTEEEKKTIRIAVGDEEVQGLLQGKEIEVGSVRTGGVYFIGCEESCAIVVIFQKENRDNAVVITLDVSNERVVSIRPNLKWISEEPERTLALVKNGKYLIEVSFNEPIGKSVFNKIGPDYNLQIEYFEYTATRSITGGATMAVFSDLEQLEDDLMKRHEATLIGITEIGARGTSEDWLRFFEGMRSNVFEVNAVQVLS